VEQELDPRLRIDPGASERARKVAIARSLGLGKAEASSIQPSFWLTPRQPWVSSGAGIAVVTETDPLEIPRSRTWFVNYRAIDQLPFGSIDIAPNPRFLEWDRRESNGVIFNDVPVNPREWLMVECYVSGADSYRLGTSPAGRTSEYPRTAASASVVTPAGTRAWAFPPSVERVRLYELSARADRSSRLDPRRWQFGGCEFTPLRV
jgi:hypothetical protein